ncbi:MAG: hypothetical protein IKD40_02420 [Bacteroidaceae bacterium]|nr:hypothetical protein [Bacteroidaceae bacterium]
MKKLIALYALMFIVLASCTQSTSEQTTSKEASTAKTVKSSSKHLTFRGVPIDGTLSEFIAKMVSKGFCYNETIDEVASLNGDFAGYEDCKIVVNTFRNENVYEILVLFPIQITWSDIENNYSSLKSMLTSKYGKPTKCVEKFANANVKKDNDKLSALAKGDCEYNTVFELNKGTITLSIENNLLFFNRVCLCYTDKINSQALGQAAIDDL